MIRIQQFVYDLRMKWNIMGRHANLNNTAFSMSQLVIPESKLGFVSFVPHAIPCVLPTQPAIDCHLPHTPVEPNHTVGEVGVQVSIILQENTCM
jgi:hypothetical protein